MLTTGLDFLPWIWRAIGRIPAIGNWLLKLRFTRSVCQAALFMNDVVANHTV